MISIIVPIFNIENYVEKCIYSLINQSYANIEIIIVDDGSTDNSLAICEEIAQTDKRIRVIHKENGGLSDARNAGIDVAKGEYIAFVDGDDFVEPHMYQYLLNILEKYGADLAMCSYCEVSAEDEIIACENLGDERVDILDGGDVYRLVTELSTDNIIACNKLYKRSIFSDVRFEKGRLHEDQWIIPYTVSKCRRIVKSSARLYCYVTRNDAISKVKVSPKRMWDLLDALRNTCVFFKSNNLLEEQKIEARHLCNYIMLYYDRAKIDFDDYVAIRYKLHKYFVEVMILCDNVFSWRQINYKLFEISPGLGVFFKKIRDKAK